MAPLHSPTLPMGNCRSTSTLCLSPTDYDDISLASPPAAHTSTRPALGSRSLSTLANAQASSGALTRSKAVLHSRTRSLAQFVPALPALNTFTNPASGRTTRSPERGSRLFGDLFSGESAPIRLGIRPSSPEKEDDEEMMPYTPTLTSRPANPRRMSMAQTHPSSSPTKPRPGNWFNRRSAISAPQTTTSDSRDEFIILNPSTALLSYDPSDVLHAATTLLTRLQLAYKTQYEDNRTLQSDLEIAQEEAEEADTRARHLKLQLEGLSQRAQEQEDAIKDMAAELLAARQELRDRDAQRRPSSQGSSSASDSGFESEVDSMRAPPSQGLVLTPEGKGRGHFLSRPSRVELGLLGRGGRGGEAGEVLRAENGLLRGEVREMRGEVQRCVELIEGMVRVR